MKREKHLSENTGKITFICERIKADTWYQLDEYGEFQEVKE